MATLRFRVSEAEVGRRLDQALAARPEIGSRSLAERLAGAGAARVGGEARPKSFRLTEDDEVEVDLPAPSRLAPETIDLGIAFADDQLVVVDKPAGIVVHPAGRDERRTLAHGLLALGAEGGEDDRPGIVHRLDRDTSGLLIVAKSEEAHRRLQGKIRDREVERGYLALVKGVPRSRTGRIEAPIGRDRRDRGRHSLDTDTPRNAITWFEARELLGDRALLEIRLETGRTHQIRVHLGAIELPVCGDPVYGIAGDLGLERQFLHAYRLAFTHPFTGERIDVESPLPPDLSTALDRARADG